MYVLMYHVRNLIWKASFRFYGYDGCTEQNITTKYKWSFFSLFDIIPRSLVCYTRIYYSSMRLLCYLFFAIFVIAGGMSSTQWRFNFFHIWVLQMQTWPWFSLGIGNKIAQVNSSLRYNKVLKWLCLCLLSVYTI